MPVPRESSTEQRERWSARRKAVGARIRELRLERGLTQEELGHAAGMDRKTVLYVELGQRSLGYERLWDISAVLNVDIVDLFVPPESMPQRITYRGGRLRFGDRHLNSRESMP
ncbi:helix-turn-helix domain-containing protein [Arthrobacter sp. DNA4]|uniref:helix-turn-helix domain-containing protein n=1 Tax=Arthrobacter sp. DNA4 TaxID=2963432 RepID=UPI00350E4AD9